MKKLILVTTFLITSLLSFAQVPVNDNCSGAISLGTLPTPAACPSGVGTAVNISGTNINATAPSPYTTLLGCQTGGNQPGPALDVWYSFVASGNQVTINITPGAPILANPAITLWTGTCGSLIGFNCDNNGTAGGNNSVTFQPLTPGQTYYIQVSGSNITQSGNFNMSVNASNDCNNCLQVGNLTVTPAPINGTYPPGTTVNFCYNITQYTQVSANWLHGVIPTFGCGWNPATLVASPPAPCSGSGTWSWWNTWTSSATGTTFGPGFAFDYNTAPGNPGNNFGDNCSTPNWNFCWSIQTDAACVPGCTNLNVTINTTGDGESGSWTSIACQGDPNVQFAAVLSCCSTTASGTNVTCFGGTNGSATATPSGSAPYTYSWNTTPVQTTQTATGLGAGTYTVTVTDNNGCVSTATVTITQPTQITVPTTQTNVTCNGGTNGSATANPSGGVGPYTYSWNTTPIQTTQTATGLGAGTYTVTVTGVGGCTGTATVTITQPTPITVTTTTVNATCSLLNGSATANPSGGVGPYTYSWNTTPIQTTQTATGLGAGTYIVTVTGVGGCTGTATVTISTTGSITATSTGTNVSCFGGTNGSATASPSGGGPYTYSWNTTPVQTTQTATGLGAGTYTCTVNSSGCITTTTITITQPTQLTSTNSQTNVTCNGGTNGSATANPSGGVGPYTYSWNTTPIQTTQTATGLGAGSYTCTITDNNGCTTTTSVNITQPTPIITTTTFVSTTCGLPNGSATANPSGGVGPYTYSWNTTPVQTTQTATGLLAGNYTVTVTDNNGCTSISTVTITNTGAPTVTIPTQTNVSCFGGNNGTANSNVVGGVGPYTYSWNTTPVQTTPNATGLPAGTYTLTVTGSNLCSSTATVTITQPTQLTAAITTSNVSCFGGNNGSSTITPSGGVGPYTYSWNTIPIQTTQTAINLTSGTYTGTVTDVNGCTFAASANITQPTALSLSVTSQTNVSCFGGNNGSITVSTSGGVGPNYLYSINSGPNQLSSTFTGLTSGTYSIVVTDQNGCTFTVNTTITQPNALSATSIVTNATCFNSCNGQIVLSVNGGNPGYTYLWSNGSTLNPLTGACAGTYSVVITDANGCTFTLTSIIVTQPNALSVSPSASPTSICIGQSSTLNSNPTGGTTPYNFLWTNSATTQNTSVSPVVTTTYNVQITDANGCTSMGGVTVTVNPPLSVTASAIPSTICAGQQSTLSANGSGGNGGPYTYVWTPGGPGQTINVSPSTTTNYTVTISDGCSPSVTSIVTVTVNPSPTVTYTTTPLSGCEPLTVTFNNTSLNTSSCSWMVGSTPLSGCNPTYTFSTPGTYNVTLTVTDNNGCSSTSPAINVNVYQVPNASFSANPTVTDVMNSLVTFTNMSSVGTYNWNFGDGNTSTMTSPSNSYGDTGVYNVQLIVTTTNGCTDTAYGTIYVNDLYTFYVPNAFTPNGNGLNEYFFPVVQGYKSYKMSIFNRWGEEIYYGDQDDKWDGTYKGQIVKEDVYVWKINVIDMNNRRHEYVGHVSVIK